MAFAVLQHLQENHCQSTGPNRVPIIAASTGPNLLPCALFLVEQISSAYDQLQLVPLTCHTGGVAYASYNEVSPIPTPHARILHPHLVRRSP